MFRLFQVGVGGKCDVGLLLFVMMVVCNYLPGGRLVGQVASSEAKFSIQNDVELDKMKENK